MNFLEIENSSTPYDHNKIISIIITKELYRLTLKIKFMNKSEIKK